MGKGKKSQKYYWRIIGSVFRDGIDLRKYCVLILIIFFTCSCARVTSSGETMDIEDVTTNSKIEQTFVPLVSRIDSREQYNPRLLHSCYYLAEEDIWFFVLAGEEGGYLVHTNIHGANLSIVDVPLVREYDMDVICVAKINDQYYVGARDSATLRGIITSIPTENNRTRSYELAKDMAVLKMLPFNNGILILGIKNENNEQVLYLTMLNDQLNVEFCNPVFSGGNSTDPAYLLNSSNIAVDDENIYIQIDYGVVGRLQPEHWLLCYNSCGSKNWGIRLPDGLSISSISATNKHVYLYGMCGDLDCNDVLVNHEALVMCYSTNGEQKWQKQFESVSTFSFGASNDTGCIAISGVEGNDTLYVCHIDSEGVSEELQYTELLAATVRGLGITTNGVAVILGNIDTELVVLTD